MTIEQLREILNISEGDTDNDNTILALYNLAKKNFTHLTRVTFELSTNNETFMNFNSDVAFLEYAPVSSIVSITYGTEDTPITDYLLVNNAVYLESVLDTRILKIEYEHGYLSIPEEVDTVLGKMVSFLWSYDDKKSMITTNGEIMLGPDDVVYPKVLRDMIAMYKVGI